jgi:hypothetical protein
MARHATTRSGACVLLVKLTIFNLAIKGNGQAYNRISTTKPELLCRLSWAVQAWLGLAWLLSTVDGVPAPLGRSSSVTPLSVP